MSDNGTRTTIQTQYELMSKYLESVKKQNILTLAMKIYPVLDNAEPYVNLYSAIGKLVVSGKSKGATLEEISSQVVAKAFDVDEHLGHSISHMFFNQPQFLSRLQPKSNETSLSKIVQVKSDNQEEKKSSINNTNDQVPSHNERQSQNFPPKVAQSPVQQNFTPVLGPMRNELFLDEPLLVVDNVNEPEDDSFVYKIGQRPQQTHINYESKTTFYNQNNYNLKKQINKANQKPALSLVEKVDSAGQRRKNDPERILSMIEDPLSSGKPATTSPSKSMFSSLPFSNKSFVFPPAPSKTSFFASSNQSKSSNKIADRYVSDSNSIRNLSQKRLCLCQTACENIVLSEDSFYCIHCENIYHTRCMKKTKDSKNCSICHMRLMIPNRVVCQELFVGLMKKGKKKHDLHFHMSEEMVNFLKSKKDFSYRLQIRCFRLKPQTQNQNLFPDSCTVSINGKQLKQFKPLHKQSSLKYRRDEAISIFKHYQSGDNKVVVTQFHTSSSSGIDRIDPEDHLIGIYMIEQEQLNATVQRIINNYVTTLQQSKSIINRSFYINDDQNAYDHGSESQAISCEVIKIPLTCALTTEKLNYPARGIFCRHFQCFDLKNFIMMTSSSSNPRWVCPICKASCYQFRIDCVLTEILNEFTGCNKVETLVLYKNGAYEILDRDEDPIDIKGNKLKNPQLKNISQLKIEDRLKRQRQKQAEKQLLRQQQAEKKKKKIIELPPQEQIISLLSDSQ